MSEVQRKALTVGGRQRLRAAAALLLAATRGWRALAASLLAGLHAGAAAQPTGAGRRPGGAVELLPAPAAVARLHVGGDDALFAVSTAGALWQHTAGAWRPLGDGFDPESPLASGGTIVAGRGLDGRLRVVEWTPQTQTQVQAQPHALGPADVRAVAARAARSIGGAALAPHAGLLVGDEGILAVEQRDGRSSLVRFALTRDGSWAVAARSNLPLLPDAVPVGFDDARPAAAGGADLGAVAVLADPDAARYRHGVLGDGVEATAVLLLDRRTLAPLAQLQLPPPHVFEDIAPRVVAATADHPPGLLTVRSGPLGGQLLWLELQDRAAASAIAGDAAKPDSGRAGWRLAVAAVGEPIGTAHRWLSPTTDGVRIAAVHTPHIGGVLQRYRRQGDRLAAERLLDGVTNHVLGSRDLDISAWVEGRLVVPVQHRGALRVIAVDAGADAPSGATIALPAVVRKLHPWRRGAGRSGVVALLEDRSVVWVHIATDPPRR